MSRGILTRCGVLVCVAGLAAAGTTNQPIEIGTVDWSHNLDQGLALTRTNGRPVFLLFQEVPGCAGCKTFGREVLSNPLLVEAIESEFNPVVVYNNRSSGDAPKICSRYGEPAWNYQVIRFLNSDGADIIPRKDRIWTVAGVATRMIDALVEAGRPVPHYLEAVRDERDTAQHATSAFAMYCFWTGERELGKIDGVVSTEAGWLDGHEVTHVVFRKDVLTLEELTERASAARCANRVYAPDGEHQRIAGRPAGKLGDDYRAASANDQKKQVQRWRALRSVPHLTTMQLTKINALAPTDMAAALSWLSPRQRAVLKVQD